MLHSLASQIAFFALSTTCLFAFVKGGVVERRAAGIILLSWLLSVVISVFLKGLFSQHAQEFTFLALDAVTSIGLLCLALRFAKIWLGVAMLMQSGELGLHGAIMADWGFSYQEYMVFNDALSFGLLAVLAGATATAWSQRARDLSPRRNTSPGLEVSV
jgi:hypothetical protein